MKSIQYLFAAACAVLIVTAGAAEARTVQPSRADKHNEKAEKKDEGSKDDRSVVNMQRWSYPLDTCAMCSGKLEAKPVEFVVNGRMVRTCCADCQMKAAKDPTEAFKKIDAGVLAAQKANYPMTMCAATGAKLDDKAVDHVHGTRLVRLANREAVAAFDKDPKAAMTKVDEAYVKAQKDAYSMKTCVVSGEALGSMGEPVDKLYGTTLVRFCCSGCVKTFEKDSDKYMKQLADARAKPPAK